MRVSKAVAVNICELVVDAATHGRLLRSEGHKHWIRKKGEPGTVVVLDVYAGLNTQLSPHESERILSTNRAHSDHLTARSYEARIRILKMKAGPS